MATDLGAADCHASGSVRATVTYELDALEIRLCGHCATKHKAELTAHGWVTTEMPVMHTVGMSL